MQRRKQTPRGSNGRGASGEIKLLALDASRCCLWNANGEQKRNVKRPAKGRASRRAHAEGGRRAARRFRGRCCVQVPPTVPWVVASRHRSTYASTCSLARETGVKWVGPPSFSARDGVTRFHTRDAVGLAFLEMQAGPQPFLSPLLLHLTGPCGPTIDMRWSDGGRCGRASSLDCEGLGFGASAFQSQLVDLRLDSGSAQGEG